MGGASEFSSDQSSRAVSSEITLKLQAFCEDSELFNANASINERSLISYATAVPKYCEKMYSD